MKEIDRKKYPRTPHLPFSFGRSQDDVGLSDCSQFLGKEVVVSEKLDGESTAIYPDGYVHARSLDSKHHVSRSWVKAYAQTFSYLLPPSFRVCGENLTAYHSIFYTELPMLLFVIGIYKDDLCLSWDDTIQLCNSWHLTTVPVIYQGIWDEEKIRSLWTGKGKFPTFEDEKMKKPCAAEGYVVRLASEFKYDDFQRSVAKMVRPHHVTSDSHWLEHFVPNKLR